METNNETTRFLQHIREVTNEVLILQFMGENSRLLTTIHQEIKFRLLFMNNLIIIITRYSVNFQKFNTPDIVKISKFNHETL